MCMHALGKGAESFLSERSREIPPLRSAEILRLYACTSFLPPAEILRLYWRALPRIREAIRPARKGVPPRSFGANFYPKFYPKFWREVLSEVWTDRNFGPKFYPKFWFEVLSEVLARSFIRGLVRSFIRSSGFGAKFSPRYPKLISFMLDTDTVPQPCYCIFAPEYCNSPSVVGCQPCFN